MPSELSFELELARTAEILEQQFGKRNPTAQAVQVFFELLREAELDAHSHYRETFWMEYINRKLIDQSWLVLTEEAEAFVREGLERTVPVARLIKSKRVEDFHAVLMMRLGNLIVAEWSHLGKCRFWLQSNPNSPRLFRKAYHRLELTEFADHVQQHYFAKQGRWQRDAAKFISL